VSYPSPDDWRDEVVYSILVDRFDHDGGCRTEGDPADGESRHGGNLAGVTKRLPYLTALGVSVIQLSPVTLAEPNCYHGYGPRHLTQVDPHLGTLDDLVTLVRGAHERGIRVLVDLVVNHLGRVFDYRDGDDFRDEPASLVCWRATPGPEELLDPRRFSRRGIIQDWTDPEHASRGDFPPGYRRLATEDPATAAILVEIACWWVAAADVDGIRVDAVRHLDPGFVSRLTREVKSFAAELGKRNFLVLAEYSASVDQPLRETLDLGVDSVYNYPEYRRQSWALHGRAPAADLRRSLHLSQEALGSSHGLAVRFIDNHDVYRFLRDGEPTTRLRPAAALLLLSAGIPALYYGSEQGFRQATLRLERECSADRAAPRNREDMFEDGAFTSASSAGDRFDTASETFTWLRELIAVRRRWQSLRRGRHLVRYADEDEPGLYAFSRLLTDDPGDVDSLGEEVLVVLNTNDRTRETVLDVGRPLARCDTLVDALDPMTTYRVAGERVAVTVPGHGVRVLVPGGEA
jgi:alpha-amylase